MPSTAIPKVGFRIRFQLYMGRDVDGVIWAILENYLRRVVSRGVWSQPCDDATHL
jgi:hypothetical protein